MFFKTAIFFILSFSLFLTAGCGGNGEKPAEPSNQAASGAGNSQQAGWQTGKLPAEIAAKISESAALFKQLNESKTQAACESAKAALQANHQAVTALFKKHGKQAPKGGFPGACGPSGFVAIEPRAGA